QDLQEILAYAFQARIAYLFVSLDDQIWGEFEPESLEIQRNGDSGPGKVDLLNLSAIYTLKHGGEVYAVPEEQMPVDDSPIVALLRF
ncbi:MAG: hypothetical protein PVF85_02465, partial [Anaerolineales bacterium]